MNTKDLFKAVSELNLEPIKMKLMHVQSGEGWSQAKADAVEKEYRRFLVLMKLYPNEDTAPLVDVDTFWHYHILDTMKYAADCEQALGGFLHHYPYVGLRGAGDQQFRIDSGNRMRELYESTFQETYPGARTPRDKAERGQAMYADPFRFGEGPVTKIGKLAASAEGAINAGTAWCAGPRGGGNIGTLAASAEGAISAGTAWCAGPRGGGNIGTVAAGTEEAVNAGTAWCAGPRGGGISTLAAAHDASVGGDTAWCAGPHKNGAGNGGGSVH